MSDQTKMVDTLEIERFSQHAPQWWDLNGPLKTLHDINPARLAWIQQYIDLKQQTVLDIGCGGGVLSEGMARRGASVTGLDLAEDAINVARQHASEQGLDVTYVCEPVDGFDAGPFDAVTCLEMLEHVPDPNVVIQAAARLVKPGGYVFFSTVNRTLKAYATVILAAEYVLSLLPRQTHTYERFIRPSELAASIRQAGLQEVGITGLSYQPFTRQARLCDGKVDVNYLLVVQKPW